MAETEDVPPGRSSALLTFALTSFVSVVLILSCFLSQGHYEISYLYVYIWTLLLSVTSIVVIMVVIFMVCRQNSVHFSLHELNMPSNMHPIGQCVYLTCTVVCGICVSVFTFFEVERAASCFKTGANTGLYSLKFLSMLFIGIFTLAEVVFIVFCRKYRCKSSWSKIFVSIVMAANFYIFVNGLLDAIRAANSDPDTAFRSDKSNFTFDYIHTLVFSRCNSSGEYVDKYAGKINLFFYPFPLEYCLLAMCVLGPMWNIIAHSSNHTSVNSETNDDNSDVTTLQSEMPANVSHDSDGGSLSKLKVVRVFKMGLKFVSNWSVHFSVPFVLSVFIFSVYVNIRSFKLEDNPAEPFDNNDTLTGYDIAYYYVQTFYAYIVSLVPFFGYLISRKNNPSRWHFDSRTILLGISALGHLLFVVFETVDSWTALFHGNQHVAEKVLYLLKILLHYIGIYCQTMFILKANCIPKKGNVPPLQLLYVKGMLIFLAACNAEHWLADSFLTAPTLQYIEDIKGDDTFGHRRWWMLTRCVFPIVVFYRLFSCLMCIETLLGMGKSSYQVLWQ